MDAVRSLTMQCSLSATQLRRTQAAGRRSQALTRTAENPPSLQPTGHWALGMGTRTGTGRARELMQALGWSVFSPAVWNSGTWDWELGT